MPVNNLESIRISNFANGRDGFLDPTELPLSKGVEQINIRTHQNVIRTALGDQRVGSDHSSNTEVLGLDKWGNDLIRAVDEEVEIYTDDWRPFKTGMTAGNRTSFLEYYGDLYGSNGADDVFRCVRSQLSSGITALSTTIPVNDPTKFTNGVSKVYINGDEIDYIGISAGVIISKSFADTPYTTTLVETTINYDATGGNSVVNLITAVGNKGKVYIIRKTDNSVNTVTVDGNGSELVLLELTQILATQGDVIVIRSDGYNWVPCSLIFASATVLDNVTNITSSHSTDDYVIETTDLTTLPKGRALGVYGEKFWVAGVPASQGTPSDPWRLYYGATALANSPENFYQFDLGGTTPEKTITANYTTDAYDKTINIDASARNVVLTLLTAAGNGDIIYFINRIDNSTNTVTVDGAGAETIDGATTITLGTDSKIAIESDNFSNWSTRVSIYTGSGVEWLAHGKETTALLPYRNNLLVAKKDSIKLVQGFNDGTPPVPFITDLYKDDGAINERCLLKVNEDVVYFTGKRLNRLFVPEQESIKTDNIFDLPVFDVLSKGIDEDQSTACMAYNPKTNLLFLSYRSKGVDFNDSRIVYDTQRGSWWLEEDIYCNDMVVVDGALYYAHSVTGRIIKDEEGYTRDGNSFRAFYHSRHIRPNASRHFDFRHLFLRGKIGIGTIITLKIYIDGQLILTKPIAYNPTLDNLKTDKNGAEWGGSAWGSNPWAGAYEEESEDFLMQEFEEWTPMVGRRHGREFWYTVESFGTSQVWEIDKDVVELVSDSSIFREKSNL